MKVFLKSFLKGFLFLNLLMLTLPSWRGNAAGIPDLIKKIELRRGIWTGLQAGITIRFTTASGQEASCQGALVYQRLDEKILLQCYSTKNHRLFALKTTDREFELYLPSHRTVYKGSIFTLEDSPEIESHLRAWDLYRAFKPMVVPSENVSAAPLEDNLTLLTISRGGEPPAISREIKVSPEGDILSETYYAANGKPSVEIQRSEFQTIGAETAGVPTVYPRQIRIISHKWVALEESITETIFTFQQADFLAEIREDSFKMSLPKSTKVMVLEDPI